MIVRFHSAFAAHQLRVAAAQQVTRHAHMLSASPCGDDKQPVVCVLTQVGDRIRLYIDPT